MFRLPLMYEILVNFNVMDVNDALNIDHRLGLQIPQYFGIILTRDKEQSP
jgi:hypothetical protein